MTLNNQHLEGNQLRYPFKYILFLLLQLCHLHHRRRLVYCTCHRTSHTHRLWTRHPNVAVAHEMREVSTDHFKQQTRVTKCDRL